MLLNPMFGPEIKRDVLSGHINMPVPQRRQAITTVFTRIPIISDTGHRPFHNEDNRGQNAVPVQRLSRQILCHLRSQGRKMLAEDKHSTELGDVSCFPPFGMIAILQPPPRICADGLEMTIGISTDPDIAISRRNPQAFQAPDNALVRDALPGRIVIGEAFASSSAGNSWFRPVHIMQTRAPGLFMLR